MTYYLTPQGHGIATERAPVPDNGKVLLTFDGDFVDSVCVNAKFYPIVGRTAEIPAEELLDENTVTAYHLGAGRRYPCDGIIRSAEGGFLVAVGAPEEERLIALSLAVARAERRIADLEGEVRSLRTLTFPTPFSFGGNQ